jgi:hypothetical protein
MYLTYTTDEVEKHKDVHRQTPLLGSEEVGDCAAHHSIPDGRGHALLPSQLWAPRMENVLRRTSLLAEQHTIEEQPEGERAALFCMISSGQSWSGLLT